MNGVHILKSINDIQFKDLNELDQVLILEGCKTRINKKSYNNIKTMILEKIKFDCLYCFSMASLDIGIDEEKVYKFDEDICDEIEISNKCNYKSSYNFKEDAKSFILFDEENNIFIDVVAYNFNYVYNSNDLGTYIKNNLKDMKNNSFKINYRKLDTSDLFVSNELIYKFNDNYLVLQLSDKISDSNFSWRKYESCFLYNKDLDQYCTFNCNIDKLMSLLEKFSNKYNCNEAFETFKKDYYEVHLYPSHLVFEDNEKMKKVKKIILNEDMFKEKCIEEHLKPIYVNDNIQFKSYKKYTDILMFPSKLYYEYKDNLSKKEELILDDCIKISKSILDYKSKRSKINPYTGELLDEKYRIEYIDDEGIILMKGLMSSWQLLSNRKDIVFKNNVEIYKKIDGIYAKFDNDDSQEYKKLYESLIEKFTIVYKLQNS